LAEIDVEDALAANQEEDEGVEDPANEDMSVEAVFARALICVDVGECEQIELLSTATTSSIDWEEDWPSDAAADKADHREHLHISQEQVRVDRLVLKSIRIGDLPELAEPIERSSRQSRSALSDKDISFVYSKLDDNLLLAQGSQVGSGSIESPLRSTQDQENREIDQCSYQGWNEGGQQGRNRRALGG
jgi:hypothetical protein